MPNETTIINYPYAQINDKNICIGVGLWCSKMDNPILVPIPYEIYESTTCYGMKWTGEYDENGYGIFEDVPEEHTTEE